MMEISKLKIDESVVDINGHDYLFKGQQRRKNNGYTASFYVFKSTKTEFEKLISTSVKIEITKKENKYHLSIVKK